MFVTKQKTKMGSAGATQLFFLNNKSVQNWARGVFVSNYPLAIMRFVNRCAHKRTVNSYRHNYVFAHRNMLAAGARRGLASHWLHLTATASHGNWFV